MVNKDILSLLQTMKEQAQENEEKISSAEYVFETGKATILSQQKTAIEKTVNDLISVFPKTWRKEKTSEQKPEYTDCYVNQHPGYVAVISRYIAGAKPNVRITLEKRKPLIRSSHYIVSETYAMEIKQGRKKHFSGTFMTNYEHNTPGFEFIKMVYEKIEELKEKQQHNVS